MDAWEQSWQETLAGAKNRPAMFIGCPRSSHLDVLSDTIRIMWEAKAFEKPCSARIFVSPNQYIIMCESGPLKKPIDAFVEWGNNPVLVESIPLIWEKLQGRKLIYDWQKSFARAEGPGLERPLLPFYFASKFAFAIRTPSGYWHQSYENGWPKIPPLLSDIASSIGFMAAGALPKEWFVGLPYTQTDVQSAISDAYKHIVNIEWHADDDLLSEKALIAENIQQCVQHNSIIPLY